MASKTAGFSLVETLIATLILGLVFISTFTLLSNVVRGQSTTMAQVALDSQANLIGQSLLRACETATFIEVPTVDAPNITTLRVWENINPMADDGNPSMHSAIVPGPVAFSHFCVDNQQLFLYQGSSYPAPQISCGGSPPGGVSRIRLSGGLPGQTMSSSFIRSSNSGVFFTYKISVPESIQGPGASVSRETAVNLQGSLE
ncbi:MAG: hypothetical protein HY078_01295 [Elusimicrobia bacterium]|nr:hypothetical protein [Elusimicrobiota bacterium]